MTTAIIHDHFDGAANCIECGGQCELRGGNLLATQLVREMCDGAARGYRPPPSEMERHYLQQHNYNVAVLMRAAHDVRGRAARGEGPRIGFAPFE